MEDAVKPVSFRVSFEEFLYKIFHLRRRDSKALVEKFTALGIYDPMELVKAWKGRKFDESWLSTEGDIHDEDIEDFVQIFGELTAAYDLNSEFQKLLGDLGWMREGEQEV